MKTLHILNGDSTLHSFRESGIEGDVLVWREVLSEGPLRQDIGSEAFWQLRADWISRTFHVAVNDYLENLPHQLPAADAGYAEINLWFEFDLHCQANLLGILEWLRNTGLNTAELYLICPADFPGMDNFRGMGELNGSQLVTLYPNKVKLNTEDLELAHAAWRLYSNHNIPGLQQLVAGYFAPNMALLKPALQAHINRNIPNANGLNYVEQKLLDIYQSGVIARTDIYQAFWKDEKIYGMGDSSIDIYLQTLSDKGLIGQLL